MVSLIIFVIEGGGDADGADEAHIFWKQIRISFKRASFSYLPNSNFNQLEYQMQKFKI